MWHIYGTHTFIRQNMSITTTYDPIHLYEEMNAFN